MCDIYEESIESKNKKSNIGKKPISKNSIKSNKLIEVISDIHEYKSLKADTSQSGSQSPSSFTNPISPALKNSAFLQNFPLKCLPSYDQLHSKFSQINSKSLRFIKVTNDLKNKIDLLEEIYSGPEYKKFKVVNKLIQCNINVNTAQKMVFNLISKLNPDNDICFGRSIHPAYSNDVVSEDSQMVMDSSGLFKVPISYQDIMSPTCQPLNTQPDYPPVQPSHDYTHFQSTPDDSFFMEHEGNTYVRVDDTNYHLIQSITEDGIITTETGLQLVVPDGMKIPFESSGMVPVEQMDEQPHFYTEPVQESGQSGRKSQKDNAFLTHYTYQTSSPAKPFSDYVGLPPRPAPQMPFTLSSQLLNPELSISLTERDCELMLTIDCIKKNAPQQQSLYYQIYSYKDEDRYSKPTSEVWGLIGEVKACPLPMFCVISIPSGVHKHYFAIRSVDEFNRFSDWSNVVQVEVESNQNSNSDR